MHNERNRRLRLARECGWLAGVALFALAAPAAQAQNAPGADSESANGEIIVTATRRNEALKDVPFAVTSISAEDLSAARVETSADLASVAPGLVMSRQGAFVQPTIRGIGSSSGGPGQDAAIPIFIDGLYLASQPGSIFDLPDISSIQVLKGPQGTLFGRNATGGLILIQTREPSFTPEGTVSLTYGQFLGAGSSAAASKGIFSGYYSGPLSENIAGSIAAYAQKAGRFLHDDVSGGKYGGLEAYLLRAKLAVKASDRLDFLLSGYVSRRNDRASVASQAFEGGTAAAFDPQAIISTKPWHTAFNNAPISRVRQYSGSLRGELDLDFAKLRSLTGYTRTSAPSESDLDVGYNSPACNALFRCLNISLPKQLNKTFQQEVTLTSTNTSDLQYVVGVFYYDDFAHQVALINGNPLSTTTVKSQAYAGFAELNYALSDRLHLVGGIRYSYEKRALERLGAVVLRVNYDAWTPKASIIYNLSDSSNIYATYSRGFKSGIINHTQTPPNSADPEFVNSYEVGFKTASSTMSANISLFYYDYTDLQVSYFTGTGGLETRNAANAKIYGVDFDATWRPSPGLTLAGGFSYLPKADYEDYPNAPTSGGTLGPAGFGRIIIDASGVRIQRSPKLTASASIRYVHDFAGGSLDASLQGYYSSRYNWDLIGRLHTGSYTTLNATVAYTPADSPFTLSVYGKNLTNEAYIVSALSSNAADSSAFAAPAEVGVTASYRF